MENGVMMQYFEWNLPNDGQLWNKLKQDAKHLHEIGVTAVWIPPAYKADEQQDEGYATYDLFDLGEFEQKGTVRTKYGTKEELKSMIDELHKYQISVYLDTVMNHKVAGDYTEKFMAQDVDPEDRHKMLSEPYEIQAWTGYTFPGRKDKYSDFKWHWYHFSGVEWDDAKRRSGIFRVVGENKYWNDDVDDEKGNYDYLLGNDLDLDHPEVIAELNKWGLWVSEELKLDGMRLDAIKHMRSGFIKQFLEVVRKERGDSFYAVGEYWNGDLETLDAYLDSVGNKLNLFDVPLHYNMYQASVEGEKYDMRHLFDNALVINRPTLAVTFVDNHDSQRGSSLESQVKDWFKPIAYALILLMKSGYPCIFYGDYYGVKGEKSPHRLILDILLDARRKYAYGEVEVYFDHPATVGFVRMGDDEHPGSGLALLVSDGKEGSKTMHVGEHRKGEVWYEFTGNRKEKVTIDEEGNGTFLVSAANLAIWVKQ
ncbi:alpha-amylase [Parabacteroides sp. PF5-5]|uniref:alpha-amylase n=1 Tax=unclassified Parabacteroides TaxID=2649774 RepID=UPI00247690D2|nr:MULTISPECIES: alpha-amylase [unclassified Parabacteroides]MDH6303892.1 alpha-amylase [Parabacteroides sp. PH5-39]MDH6314509.1 alpha-amylase [Parabacteroides sp. PF5-13]MDH6318426.1 alpha-amylase [Parabacteroides sp. PH5-13]MDH6322281.1 alpha-amylase [Parabacteroides sp. PH5-8]MDH6325639.1 alpha-amylase [Parabacteroides sp. PH5-41]